METHACWEEFSAADVEEVLRFTRRLIREKLIWGGGSSAGRRPNASAFDEMLAPCCITLRKCRNGPRRENAEKAPTASKLARHYTRDGGRVWHNERNAIKGIVGTSVCFAPDSDQTLEIPEGWDVCRQ